MKYFKFLASAFVVASVLSACNDDVKLPGNPVMEVTGNLGSAAFGDTLRFDVKASDAEVPLSTIHADLYFGSEKVSEQVIRTKVSGETYPVAVYIPYLANIPDGDALLQLKLQNIHFTITEQNFDVSIYHKDYPSLTLVTEEGQEYVMVRDAMYSYSVTDNFPQQLRAKIYSPVAEDGSQVVFGYENGEIRVNGSGYIPFSYASSGSYTVSFDTYTFEGAPFLSPTINGENMQSIDDDNVYCDLNLAKGASLEFDGFPEFECWWLNPDYIQAAEYGNYSFMAYDGTYRFIANLKQKYFKVVKLVGSEPATLNQDGTGNVWIIGEGIGYPNLSNQPGWDASKGIPMAPTGERTYKATVVGGINIDISSINFKFFGQPNWADAVPNGLELTGDMLTSQSTLIGVGKGQDVNGHDNGNIFLNEDVTLEANGIYVITVDLTGGVNNGILNMTLEGQQEFDEEAVYLNGEKMNTIDNSTYSLVMSVNQFDKVEIKGASLGGYYIDQDYFAVNGSDIQFMPVAGYYNFVLDKGRMTLGAQMVNADGSEMTLSEDGSGALWLMGWGVGSPSQDYQFGWDPGKAYSLAQVAPKVYQFTGKAGPETGSVAGDRLRYDYISMKFFWQNGWGGEFNNTEHVLSMIGSTSTLLQNGGNFELAAGVNLSEGDTYRITVDLTQGVDKGTINFEKL